jgi:hypothetical protein
MRRLVLAVLLLAALPADPPRQEPVEKPEQGPQGRDSAGHQSGT